MSALHGADRRWAIATQDLRLSLAASQHGNRRQAARQLLRALVIYPEGIVRRLFWGCLRRMLTAPGPAVCL